MPSQKVKSVPGYQLEDKSRGAAKTGPAAYMCAVAGQKVCTVMQGTNIIVHHIFAVTKGSSLQSSATSPPKHWVVGQKYVGVWGVRREDMQRASDR